VFASSEAIGPRLRCAVVALTASSSPRPSRTARRVQATQVAPAWHEQPRECHEQGLRADLVAPWQRSPQLRVARRAAPIGERRLAGGPPTLEVRGEPVHRRARRVCLRRAHRPPRRAGHTCRCRQPSWDGLDARRVRVDGLLCAIPRLVDLKQQVDVANVGCAARLGAADP